MLVIVALRAGKMKTYANCDGDSDETADRRTVDGKVTGYRRFFERICETRALCGANYLQFVTINSCGSNQETKFVQ